MSVQPVAESSLKRDMYIKDCQSAIARFSKDAQMKIAVRALQPVFQSLALGQFFRKPAGDGDFTELGLALASIFEKPVRKITAFSRDNGLRSQVGQEYLTDIFDDETLWKTKLYAVYEAHELWLWPLISSFDCLGCGYDQLRHLFVKEMTACVGTKRASNLIYETADAIVWSLDFYLAFALAKNKRCLNYFNRLIRLFPAVVPVREQTLGSGHWLVIVK